MRLAVKKGCKLVEVHEVYDVRVTQYDTQTRAGGLFVQYIDTFLKLMVYSSGYRSWVQSPSDEDRYISECAAREDIKLEKDAISTNPAKGGQAKLCVNSMWGKLTERNDRTCTKIISDPQELYRFLSTPGIEVAALMFSSDNVVWASWRYIAEEMVPNLRYNIVIGA